MPRIRSGDQPPPRLSRKYLERVAQLHGELKRSRFEELTQEEVANIFQITPTKASILITEYDREHPGARTVRRISVVRLARGGDARGGDARSGDATT